MPVVVERDRDGVNSSVGLSRLDATDVGRVSLSCQCQQHRGFNTTGVICQRQMLEIERSEANEWQINILTNDFPALSAHRLSSMIRRSSVELGRGWSW